MTTDHLPQREVCSQREALTPKMRSIEVMLWMIRGCQKKGAYRDDMGEMQGGPEA